MAQSKILSTIADERIAVLPTTCAAGAVMTAIPVKCDEGRRARFTFMFGALSGSGNVSTGFGVWKASDSSGTYSLVASGAAISSGVASNYVAVIDVKVDPDYPWLKVSNLSAISSAMTAAVSVLIYGGKFLPTATTTPAQVVIA